MLFLDHRSLWRIHVIFHPTFKLPIALNINKSCQLRVFNETCVYLLCFWMGLNWQWFWTMKMETIHCNSLIKGQTIYKKEYALYVKGLFWAHWSTTPNGYEGEITLEIALLIFFNWSNYDLHIIQILNYLIKKFSNLCWTKYIIATFVIYGCQWEMICTKSQSSMPPNRLPYFFDSKIKLLWNSIWSSFFFLFLIFFSVMTQRHQSQRLNSKWLLKKNIRHLILDQICLID